VTLFEKSAIEFALQVSKVQYRQALGIK